MARICPGHKKVIVANGRCLQCCRPINHEDLKVKERESTVGMTKESAPTEQRSDFYAGRREYDEVNKAAHYNQGPMACVKCNHPIECIDIVKHFNFMLGNTIKYIWRNTYKHKALQDLKKARYYLDCQIRKMEEEETKSESKVEEGEK